MVMATDGSVLLQGEVLLAVVWPGLAAGAVPSEMRALPGPCLIAALRGGADSGSGLFVSRLVHVGIRPALWVTTAVVSDQDTRVRLQGALSVPAEIGTLNWAAGKNYREVA